MTHGISVSFNPIGPWPVLVGAAVAVTVLTLWAYSRRLRGTRRPLAVCRRVAALARLVALPAGGAAAVGLLEREEEARRLDRGVARYAARACNIGDEVRGQSRWDVATQAVKQAQGFRQDAGARARPQVLRVRLQAEPSPRPGEPVEEAKPAGRETSLGTAMLEAQKRIEGTSRRMARLVILSDFATNSGSDPLEAARSLKGQGVPVVTVGLGTENAGAVHRDIRLRDIIAGPTVFVKNRLRRTGSHRGQGFRQPDAQRRAVRRRPGGGRSPRPR